MISSVKIKSFFFFLLLLQKLGISQALHHEVTQKTTAFITMDN